MSNLFAEDDDRSPLSIEDSSDRRRSRNFYRSASRFVESKFLSMQSTLARCCYIIVATFFSILLFHFLFYSSSFVYFHRYHILYILLCVSCYYFIFYFIHYRHYCRVGEKSFLIKINLIKIIIFLLYIWRSIFERNNLIKIE